MKSIQYLNSEKQYFFLLNLLFNKERNTETAKNWMITRIIYVENNRFVVQIFSTNSNNTIRIMQYEIMQIRYVVTGHIEGKIVPQLSTF